MFPSTKPTARALAALGLAWVLVTSVGAQTELEITWSSSFLTEKMILSDGLSLDSGGGESIIIEIGTFGSDFTPTEGNMDEWTAHWQVFDAITSYDPDQSDGFVTDPADSTYGRYAGSAELTEDGYSTSEDASFQNPDAQFDGQQAFVFIRTTDDLSGGAQWLLFTSAVDSDGTGSLDSVWQFPASGGEPQFNLLWTLDQADTAIVGAIHGGDTMGGDTGGGSYTDGSTDFALRLHVVAPEPGVTSLILLFLAASLRRRVRIHP